MENNYLELKQKVEAMESDLERARLLEVPKVVASIKKQIEEYKIAPDDLYPGLRSQLAASRSGRSKRDRPAKYRSPTGETWSGGPGRKPMWVREIEAKGEDLEKYRIEMPQ